MTKRIGLLTLPLNSNFGGIIQALSLSEAMRKMGYEVVLLDRRRPIARWQRLVLPLLAILPFQNIRGFRGMERARRFHRAIIDRHFDGRSAVLRSSEDMRVAAAAEKLDAVVVGSDQVWRMSYLHPQAVRDFFLGFLPKNGPRRVSYAASFGVGTWQNPERTTEISRLLHHFDAVSVREQSGVEICRETFGRDDAVHVLDPTLLVDTAFHHVLADSTTPPERSPNKRGALFYMLDAPKIQKAALSALGDEYEAMSLSLSDSASISVPQWLSAFKSADFVITDSYHGTIFAIIFRKPFLSIINHSRGAERFTSLLSKIGLDHRLLSDDCTGQLVELIAQPIDYDAVHEKLSSQRDMSVAFLKQALE